MPDADSDVIANAVDVEPRSPTAGFHASTDGDHVVGPRNPRKHRRPRDGNIDINICHICDNVNPPARKQKAAKETINWIGCDLCPR